MVTTPPVSPGSVRGIDELLAAARTRLERLDAHQAYRAAESGALLVDIRYAALRDRDGTIPGALVVERNELEWRLDPLCDHRLPEAAHHGQRIVVICNEGYASSLAAASLQALGLHRATDLAGGFQAWRAAGLPVDPPGGTDRYDGPDRPAQSER
ncbi:rhodanese-like domain-containing protein [Streptomyces sp. RB6PN25]|uniref:Rhodanese-like domain-containing protein n=1 Tax=Streptomyces humicola TaxID=2953240 RepID=A0ABT1PZ32_9ACTN|nr:rhodanese-like domain-containing protein [Streptomyces humicola]MCQ4082935.1 rhodanese-like domain-containing protein [Streptomyces humicola]